MSDQSTISKVESPAPLWRILAAMLYDSLLLLACYIVIGGLYVGIAQGLLTSIHPTEGAVAPANAIPAYMLQLTLFPLLSIFTFLFFAYFWRKQGCTLGMQTWKIVVKADAASNKTGYLSFKQCLIRFTAACLSIGAGGLGYWWKLWDPQKRTWQDHLSKSSVYMRS